MIKGRVHSIETFGAVDGPGIRYIVFMQGCGMRCLYCHNADTFDMHGGQWKTTDEIIDDAENYRRYWGKDGGITVSGGEALLQIDFVLELFMKAKLKGINTCIDTSGEPFTRHGIFFDKLKELMRYTDLLIVDIKHMDEKSHLELTGRSNKSILDFLLFLSEIKKPAWIRHVLIPEITDRDDSLYKMRRFISMLENIEKVEILPYHDMGAAKWEKAGLEYRLSGIGAPSKQRIENAEQILAGKNILFMKGELHGRCMERI